VTSADLSTTTRAWLTPGRLALGSGLAAACALGAALWGTAAPSEAALRERSLTQSPERVAEAFIVAYDAHDYEQAASLAVEPLQSRVRARARRNARDAHDASHESTFLIEESYFLSEGRLRLLGSLTRASSGHDAGWPVAILVGRHGDRFLVENLSWPKGPIPEAQ
jgi:hypothetical protein